MTERRDGFAYGRTIPTERRLEKRTSILHIYSAQEKFRLPFVLMGFAPAADFFSFSPEITERLSTELQELGLVTEHDGSRADLVFFSKNHDSLANLLDAFRSFDHRRMGEAYGFPKSSIDVWPEGSIELEDVPADIRNDPLFRLLPFRLSREHYQEEWDGFTQQCQTVERQMPELLRELDLDATGI